MLYRSTILHFNHFFVEHRERFPPGQSLGVFAHTTAVPTSYSSPASRRSPGTKQTRPLRPPDIRPRDLGEDRQWQQQQRHSLQTLGPIILLVLGPHFMCPTHRSYMSFNVSVNRACICKRLGSPELIPRNRSHQPMQPGRPVQQVGCRTGPPGCESIPGLKKGIQIRAQLLEINCYSSTHYSLNAWSLDIRVVYSTSISTPQTKTQEGTGTQTDKNLPQRPFTGQCFKMTTFYISFYEFYLSTTKKQRCQLSCTSSELYLIP